MFEAEMVTGNIIISRVYGYKSTKICCGCQICSDTMW